MRIRLSSQSLGWVAGMMLFTLAGCNNKGPFVNSQAGGPWQGAAVQQQAIASQMSDLNRRASSLDADNNNLHTELAKAQQQVQVLNETTNKLSRQLTDTVNQLRDEQLAKKEAERQVAAIQASTRYRGGATIKANDSLAGSLQAITIPGVEVERDNDVIRISLQADRLFVPGTVQLQPSAAFLLDQVADAIARNYPRQMIGVEAHTEGGVAPAPTTQQLTTSQSLVVYSSLVTRNRLNPRQLFTVAHGANHPLASNATAAGRAKNRRVELVVYPDSVN
jgi:flagellar motor protein MotB